MRFCAPATTGIRSLGFRSALLQAQRVQEPVPLGVHVPAVASMLTRRGDRIIGPSVEAPMQVTPQTVAVIQPMHEPGFDQRYIHGFVRQGTVLKDTDRVEPQFVALAWACSYCLCQIEGLSNTFIWQMLLSF